jgi:hypothetical protein
MKRMLTALLVVFITQIASAGSGALFQVRSSGAPAGTNGTLISLTICLDGKGSLSCQNYYVPSMTVVITPTINRTYANAGIKINTPGFTPTGCTPANNGYCLFAVSQSQPANINVTATNVVPLLVNAGPPGVDAQNSAFVSITICEPGTTNCQTIDNIQVDTGSTGIRIISSELHNSLNLPALIANGAPVAECYTYVSSSVWGSVKQADVTVGGETAHSVPIHIMGDPSSPYATVPGSCPGPITDTVISFGAKGIIGVNNSTPDCGAECVNASTPVTAFYYSCSNTDCSTSINLPLNLQVPNPVTLFPVDNNGTVLLIPAIPLAGEISVEGSLIFGIGTANNNQLGNSTIIKTDSSGNFKTLYNSTLLTSYTDNGTNDYIFPNNGSTTIPVLNGYYNPSEPLSLQATMRAHDDSARLPVNFTIVSEPALPADITAALIASPGSGLFVWGLSSFFGHSLFTAIDGANTIYGKGPYIAY